MLPMPRRARSTLRELIKEEGSVGASMDVSGSMSVELVSADTSLPAFLTTSLRGLEVAKGRE